MNVAQAGLPWMLNVRRSPSASAAEGRNAYTWPTVALLAGEPVIVGARFVCATVIENAGRLVVAVPSLTLITMLEVVPALVGVPASEPSALLNVAQVGLPWMLNVSGHRPRLRRRAGTRTTWPTVALLAGEPVIVGARFVCATVIENAGRLVVAVPSLTLITMLEVVPALVGVPESEPSALLNVAQAGLPWMLNVSGRGRAGTGRRACK